MALDMHGNWEVVGKTEPRHWVEGLQTWCVGGVRLGAGREVQKAQSWALGVGSDAQDEARKDVRVASL